MTRLRRLSGGVFIFAGTGLAIASCAQDARDFTPVDGGGEGGDHAGVGGSGQSGGSPNTGGDGGDGSGTGGGGGSGGRGTGGDGVGGGGTCTDELPSGDECGGSCEPCPDGLSCDDASDCTGDVCTSEGECCTTIEEGELCDGKCGMVDNCGAEVTCGSCVGEATCNGQNVCGCPAMPCAIFSSSFGNANQEYIAGLAVDGAGNVYVVGDYRGTLQFGSLSPLTSVVGPTVYDDVFLVKFDPMGDPVWAKSFGDGSDQEARGVAVDGAGNVVVIARSSGTINFGGSDLVTDSDMVIAKFNGAGVHQFSAAYGDDNVHPRAVAIDQATGEIIVTGEFYNTLKFGSLATMTSADVGAAYFDTFMVRFNAAGVPQYSRRFGGGLDELPESAAALGSYAYVAGTFAGLFDFGSPNPVELDSTGWADLYVAKLGKSTFSHVWSRRFGDYGANGYAVDTPRMIVDAPTGDVVVAGNFSGTMEFTPELSTSDYEMFIVRLAADDGASVWAEQYANAQIGAMTLGPDGHLYLTGTATGDIDFGGGTRTWSGTDDVFIAKLTLDGDHVYSRVFSSPTGVQRGQAIAVTSGREAWVGARFDGQLQFGLSPLQTQGGSDIAIGKYAP